MSLSVRSQFHHTHAGIHTHTQTHMHMDPSTTLAMFYTFLGALLKLRAGWNYENHGIPLNYDSTINYIFFPLIQSLGGSQLG